MGSAPRLFSWWYRNFDEGNVFNELQSKINHELASVLKWTEMNNLTINPTESDAIVIPPTITQKFKSIDISFNSCPIYNSEYVK